MTLVYTGANYAHGADASDLQRDVQIDAVTITDAADVNIGPTGYRVWLRCRVEVVADALDSSAQSLHVYAKVSDWLDNPVSGGVDCYPKYYQRFSNGTAYTYGRLNENDAGTTKGGVILGGQRMVGAYPGIYPGIFKNTGGPLSSRYPEWTVYFDLGTVTPGSSVITPVYKVGFVPDAWRWSGESSVSVVPPTVTVSYNANASGENVGQDPTSQIRFKGWTGCGFSTTVAGSPYQRTGWAFTKWNTASDGTGVDYDPGDEYDGTSDVVLYAQWERTTKTITYNENTPQGATGTVTIPPAVTVDANVVVYINTADPGGNNYTPPYTFMGWDTNPNSTSPIFPAGASVTYTSQNSVNLYAIWSTDYVRPSFLNGACKAFRSTSSGQPEGTEGYLTVTGTVVVNPTTLVLNNRPKTLVIKSGNTQILDFIESDFTDNGDGTWSFSKTSASSILNPGTTYSLTATFMDQFMTEYPSQTGISAPLISTGITIPVAFITFSTNARGMSAAFGAQAAQTVTGDDNVNNGPGRLDVNMNAYFHGKVAGIPVDGTTIDYNGNGELSYIGVSGPEYTEQSGGTTMADYNTTGNTWPTTYACTKNGNTIYGCGWREIKHRDGRLEKWVWGWQTASTTSTSAYLNNFWREMPMPPATSTPFIDSPNTLWVARANNTGAGVWITQENDGGTYTGGSWESSGWTNGSTITFSYSFYNNVNGSRPGSTKCLFQVYLDGHWQ